MTQPPDADTRAVIDLLKAAVDTSGLSQAAFARALGTSASRFSTYATGTTRPSAHFCMRAQRLAQALRAAALRGLMSAPDTATEMRTYLRSGDREWAWRMLLQGRDHLRLILDQRDGELLGSWEAAPSTTGSPEFDALLAALARHEFEATDRPAPEWTAIEPLPQPWAPEHPFLSPERARAKTPAWLRELNIYIPARDLVTA